MIKIKLKSLSANVVEYLNFLIFATDSPCEDMTHNAGKPFLYNMI